VAAIEALVAAGHDPNVKMGCWFDSEPLGWAASFGQCKAIEALCAAGADPRRPANTSGNTPLSDAQREGHSKAIELINEYLSGARPIGKPVPADSWSLNTPSHGNPKSTSALNTELNNVARNTDDTAKARALVAAGADLSSTNGPDWRHTPLHQAAYHGRFEMAKTLVELGSKLDLHSNPVGRGATGTPLELARGGGHHAIAKMLEEAAGSSIIVGKRVTRSAASAQAPPELHKIVKKLRVELGMPHDLPVAQAVDRAVATLGLDVGKGAGLLQKAEAAWKALDV